jgi:hypothetical protein
MLDGGGIFAPVSRPKPQEKTPQKSLHGVSNSSVRSGAPPLRFSRVGLHASSPTEVSHLFFRPISPNKKQKRRRTNSAALQIPVSSFHPLASGKYRAKGLS